MSQQTQHLTLHQFGYVDTGHGWCVVCCYCYCFCFDSVSFGFHRCSLLWFIFRFHFYVLPNPFIPNFGVQMPHWMIFVFLFSLSSVYLNSKFRDGNCWEKKQSSYTYGTCPMAKKSHIHFAEKKKLHRQTMSRYSIKDYRIYIQRITLVVVL